MEILLPRSIWLELFSGGLLGLGFLIFFLSILAGFSVGFFDSFEICCLLSILADFSTILARLHKFCQLFFYYELCLSMFHRHSHWCCLILRVLPFLGSFERHPPNHSDQVLVSFFFSFLYWLVFSLVRNQNWEKSRLKNPKIAILLLLFLIFFFTPSFSILFFFRECFFLDFLFLSCLCHSRGCSSHWCFAFAVCMLTEKGLPSCGLSAITSLVNYTFIVIKFLNQILYNITELVIREWVDQDSLLLL